MASWRYYSGPDGAEFGYSVHPAFVCPYEHERLQDAIRDMAEDAPPTDTMLALRAAAHELGLDAGRLALILRRAHSGIGRSGRERVDDRLTDRCAGCGHKMERLGFRCWIARPMTEEEIDASGTMRATIALNQRLGSEYKPKKVVREVYLDTRKEAREWALEEWRTARAVAAEEAV